MKYDMQCTTGLIRFCSRWQWQLSHQGVQPWRGGKAYGPEDPADPVFTALHCLSVCLSHAWSLTKLKKYLSRFLYHTKD